MDAGAAGGAFSRNTVTHPNPEKIVKAIRKIIHAGASIAEAANELN
jgi:DhnA family fructose-bisphosphate aldolase class Ia